MTTRTKDNPNYRGSKYEMISVDDALERILQECSKIAKQTERVDIYESEGRIISDPVTVPWDMPPFPASLKDGYCLHMNESDETENKTYNVDGTILAGQNAFLCPPEIASSSVYKIMTGAPVPPSCNTVVMIEYTELLKKSEETKKEEKIKILKNVRVGQDIRKVGSDAKMGEILLKENSLIGPAEIGLLASCGYREINVWKAPTVAVLSTGDEVIDPTPNASLKAGQIFDANRGMLIGLLKSLKVNVIDGGIVKDEYSDVSTRIEGLLSKADILISSGGVSMGDVDLLKRWMEENGNVIFGRVSMKPGKPLTFATVTKSSQTKLIFATPGNPVSSLVTSHLFVVPALRALLGASDPYNTRILVTLQDSLKLDPERPEYHRASVYWYPKDNEFFAFSTGSQASSRLLSMRSANALLELPQKSGTIHRGEHVTALLISNFTTISDDLLSQLVKNASSHSHSHSHHKHSSDSHHKHSSDKHSSKEHSSDKHSGESHSHHKSKSKETHSPKEKGSASEHKHSSDSHHKHSSDKHSDESHSHHKSKDSPATGESHSHKSKSKESPATGESHSHKSKSKESPATGDKHSAEHKSVEAQKPAKSASSTSKPNKSDVHVPRHGNANSRHGRARVDRLAAEGKR